MVAELDAAMAKKSVDAKVAQHERQRMLTEHDAIYSLADGAGTSFRQLFAARAVIVTEKGAEPSWIKPQDMRPSATWRRPCFAALPSIPWPATSAGFAMLAAAPVPRAQRKCSGAAMSAKARAAPS